MDLARASRVTDLLDVHEPMFRPKQPKISVFVVTTPVLHIARSGACVNQRGLWASNLKYRSTCVWEVKYVECCCWCFPGGMHFTNFQFNSQLFTTFHNFSQLFTTLFFFVGEAFKCRHLHFRNPSGQWWGQFAEMDKFSSFPHSAQYTGTQVHHITFYLVNPSIPLNGWATTQPKKKPPTVLPLREKSVIYDR